MRRVWIDVETTGLDSNENGIVQIALIVEAENGQMVRSFSSKMKPFKGCEYSKEALEINGMSKKEIKSFKAEKQVLKDMLEVLDKDKKPYTQYEFAGYNSRFDMGFVEALFERNGVEFWKYFSYHDVDTFAFVKILGLTGKRYDEDKGKNVKCKKLTCICDMFGIEFDAHDAIEDIKATRRLHHVLTEKYLK